ncbi:serologically defined colon cancer antigen 8 homolog isoform X2 [Diachasma alloeum]|uniref:serologically defined colon cancer antigen 8 homolog isoform X2 n=1 Tax=Diachasma alloeum TaxID=454923 RepID=UPI000738495B|nr:serologically defined colon cancer antigen 8 homolog isoform X2 [Diachasma alloeum]
MLTTSNYPRRCRTGGTSVIGVSTSPGTLLTRPKLPLRSYIKPRGTYHFSHIENAPFGRPKRFRVRKMSSLQKMDVGKKKMPDYTETAYREAVSKLKYLLAESYTPRSTGKIHRERGIYRRSNLRLHESAEDTDDRSAVSECISSADKVRLPASILTAEDSQLTPRELTSFIMRQEQYIEQLEQESRYCKNELKNLLGKIREVVAENEALHDKNKTGLLKAFLTEYESCDEVKRLEGKSLPSTELEVHSSPGKKMKLQRMDGPAIMYESRISELEAQLTQARIELKKALEDKTSSLKRSDTGASSPEAVVQLEQVMREKRETNSKLDETLKSLQAARERETEASQKAKRAMDSAQQAEFEKSQAEAEIRRLKDELERQREKIREATQDACRRLAEERHQVERRYGHQMEQLSADVATHWDAASKSQLEIEKQRREILDLKRELNQKQAVIEDLKKEMQSKTSSLQSDLTQLSAEKDAVEQELATAKLGAERSERHARQEQSRWQTEINSYKQRIERADADIVHCRRENLRLSEQIASLEKELNMTRIIHVETTATPRKDKNKDVTSMIMDMEGKNAAQLGGLEDALSNQAKLISQLTAECQSLTQRLEANNHTHKEEMARLQSNIDYLTSKFRDTLENPKGKLSSTPESGADPSKQSHKPATEETHPQDPTHPYSATSDDTYAHSYTNPQQKPDEMDQAQYQDPQNYENYPADYSTQDYSQYEQYEPSSYQQSAEGTHGQTEEGLYDGNQQYEHYGNNDYLENQQVPHDQQYVESNPGDNVA